MYGSRGTLYETEGATASPFFVLEAIGSLYVILPVALARKRQNIPCMGQRNITMEVLFICICSRFALPAHFEEERQELAIILFGER